MSGLPKDFFNICITIIQARDLPHQNISSFACVQVGKVKKCTRAVKHTDKPHFDEYFVFDLHTDLSFMLSTQVTVSLFEPMKSYRLRKMIGTIMLELSTVWALADRVLRSWLMITLPKDISAQQKGFVLCDIRIEAGEKHKQVPNILPMVMPEVVGTSKVRVLVQIYHCKGLHVVEEEYDSVYVSTTYAGVSENTTKRKFRENPEWNEQITFVEMSPPLFQKITLKIILGKRVLAFKDFHLTEMSHFAKNGFLPTYGPTYAHFYTNGCNYCGSLFMAVETITLFKYTHRVHSVLRNPVPPPLENKLFATKSFLCYGLIFDVVGISSNVLNNVYVSLSFGSVGISGTKTAGSNTVTPRYRMVSGGNNIQYLPLNECKPCLYARADWPDTRYRLSNSNLIARSAHELKRQVVDAVALISRGNNDSAALALNNALQKFKNDCKRIPGQLIIGATKFDLERVKLITNQLNKLASTVTKENNVDNLLNKINDILSFLNAICEDVQDSFPSIILSLKQNETVLGYCQIHPRDIHFSSTDAKSGSNSGKITSLFLKKLDSTEIVGRVDIWLWLGLWDHVSNCLLSLPPGHDDIAKAVSLPDSLTYSRNTLFTIVCYIYGGNISDGLNEEGLCSPFVRLIVSRFNLQTTTAKRSLAPLWKESLVFTDVPLYPSQDYIKDNPPFITVQLWDDSRTPAKMINCTLVQPNIRLGSPIAEKMVINPQWITLGESQILAAFEIIETCEESGNMRKFSNSKVQFVDPPSNNYRLEVIFWGIRSAKVERLKNINQPQVTIQCGNAEIKSNVITRGNIFQNNFLHNLNVVTVEMPDAKYYSPPFVLRVVTAAKYFGSKVDANVQRFVSQLPTEEEWKALTTSRKSVLDRAGARHFSVYESIPDLIPLIDVNHDWRSSQEMIKNNKFHKTVTYICDAIKKMFGFLKPILLNFQSKMPIDLDLDGDGNEEECDYWYKYSSERIKLYKHKLEDDLRFNNFQDVLKSFEVKQQNTSGKDVIVNVKAMMCLYRWPVQVPVVTTQGQDPSNGVLTQTELSERVKVLVRVYCLKAHHLHPADSSNSADPYIEIATPSKVVSDKHNYISRQLNPVFGKCLEVEAEFPVDTVLSVRVMDWDRISAHDLIGETVVDLENRFYSKHRATCGLSSSYSKSGYDAWRDVEKPTEILERLCNAHNLPLPQYFNKSVLVASKEFIIDKNLHEKDDNEESLALNALRRWSEVPIVGLPLVHEHVERRLLFQRERPGIEQGELEMWVDMFDLSLGDVPPAVDITPRAPQIYELRVVILRIVKVPLVDDSLFYGRNHVDIFLKSWLWDHKTEQSTDVHFMSTNGEGNFNWRFKFPLQYIKSEKKMVIQKKDFLDLTKSEVKVPPLLHIQVWDHDRLSANDFIGSSTFDLSCMPRGALTAKTCKIPDKLTSINSANLFKVKRLRGWWALKAKSGSKKKSAGFLEAEFTLLTDEEAIAIPAGLGRNEPNALSPPIRPDFKVKFWLAPFRIIIYLLCGVHKGKMIMCLFFFAVTVFLLVGIYSVPVFFVKRILGA